LGLDPNQQGGAVCGKALGLDPNRVGNSLSMFSEGKEVKPSGNIDKHDSNQFSDISFQIWTPGLGPD